MSKQENIKKEVEQLQHIAGKPADIDQKLEELVALLARTDLDSDKVKDMRQRLNQALDVAEENLTQQIEAFQHIDDSEISRLEMLEEFSVLLSNTNIDSRISKRYLRGEMLSGIFMIAISLVLITLGYAMIIMPAPPYFEMFTVFYFSRNDGVTLMDLISLLIILTGIYLLIRTIFKLLNRAK